jgi:hypothetical protein
LRRSGLLQLLDAFFERRNGLGSLRECVLEFGDSLGLAFDLGLTGCARGFGSALGFGRCIAGTLLCFGRLFELLDFFVERRKLVRQGFHQLAVVLLGRRSSRRCRGFLSALGRGFRSKNGAKRLIQESAGDRPFRCEVGRRCGVPLVDQ